MCPRAREVKEQQQLVHEHDVRELEGTEVPSGGKNMNKE